MPLHYKNHLSVSTAVVAALSLSAVAGLAIPKAPQAETPAKPAAPDAPKRTAQDVLAAMAAKYQGLTSYSADASFAKKRGADTVNLTSKVAYKPGKAAVSVVAPTGTTTLIFDGKTLFAATSADTKTYQKLVPKSSIQGVQTTLSQADVGLLPFLLVDPSAKDKILLPNSEPPVLEPEGGVVEGVAVDVVTSNMRGGMGTLRFDIGKEDGLLRRISLSEKKDGVEVSSLTSTYRNIKTNTPLDDSLFVFKPAPGQVAQEAPATPQSFDPRLKKGATPLPLAGTDTTGKALNLAQYKGKVVLVDFWATWCGPCREELPNVTAVYGKYKPKGFDVIGVSLDDADAKPKLVKFIQENKMPWRQVFDGGGWDSKLAASYGIKAIPFTLLIGRNGKIAAVNPRGPELEPAVTAALAAK